MRSFKWIGKIACLCVLLATLAVSASAAEFAGGSGTANDPYLIATTAQLNNVRNYLSKHFKMTADIVFTDADFAEGGAFYNGGAGWTPIGDYASPFKGFFDGDGHTITGLKQNITADTKTYGGLFGYAFNANIRNLGMVDSDISVTTTTGFAYAGGIVGEASTYSTINGCYNMGEIVASSELSKSYAGGVVGYANLSTIGECYNKGAVNAAASTSSSHAGGIAGYVGSGNTISNCYNTGAVTATASYPSSYTYAYAGGIVGYAYCTNGKSTISECYNSGAVSASGLPASSYAVAIAGGITGKAYNSTISNCYNMGTVSLPNSYTGDVGGVAGSADRTTISSCYNMGAVSSPGSGPVYVGGIVGYAAISPTITNCYNTGTIMGACSGGIVGYADSLATITNCYNTGAVSTSRGYMGGIVGYVYNSTVSNCYYLDTCSVGVNGEGTDANTKCTAEQMKAQGTFVGFDFTNTWTMAGNASYLYPELIAVPMVSTAEPVSIDISSVSTTSATLTIANNEAGKCYVAVYNTDGQMLSYGLTSVTADASEVTVSITPFTTTSQYMVKAFLVDTQGVPVCQRATTE